MKQHLLLFIASIVSIFSFADTTYVYQLPFEEDFVTGVFTTNQWTVEGTNWIIAGQQGNPPPSAMFTYTPVDTNYSQSLISPPIAGSGFVSGLIYLDYDIKLDVQNSGGVEKLSAEVFDGNQWVTFYTDSSTGDTDWEKRHINISSAAKGDTFQVRFRAYGENTFNISNWLIDNIIVYRYCPEPTELLVYLPYPGNNICLLELEWNAPYLTGSGNEAWLNWDDGTNIDAIGLQNGGTFSTAVRFTTSQLIEYAGTSLTKMRIFPYGPNGSIILKVWTGANAGTLVLSQPIASYSAGQWNEFELDTSILVTATTELWFGYEVTHDSIDYVAGVDGGPAVSGYGDMISLDGSVWESMSQAYQKDYNWNIHGWVEMQPPYYIDTAGVESYNIYREGLWVGNTTDIKYSDTLYGYGHETICYEVTAVYEDCESGLSNEDCEHIHCDVGTSFNELSNIRIHPNPAVSYVDFKLDGQVDKIVLFDLLGNVISWLNIKPGNLTFHQDLSNYRCGVYLVKFITISGDSIVRKLIVAH